MPSDSAPPSLVRVRVPATSANLGPGFDTLGVALDWTAELTFEIGRTAPVHPDGAVAAIERMAGNAVAAIRARVGEPPVEVAVTYEGDLPVGRGLGMSAAARAAGLVAGNHLAGGRCSEGDLVALAVELEGHGDNILPALFGGLQVVVQPDRGPVQHVAMMPPDDLRLALLIPEFSMPTEESRKRLPDHLSRAEAVHNIGRASLMVAALSERRYDVLRTAVQDVLHQPARGSLFPAFYPIVDAAHGAGAFGAYLSGGGSTVAAFTSPEAGDAVASAMLGVARDHGLDATIRVVRMRTSGTEVMDS